MVGYLPPSAAKAHAVDAKPKPKPKAKAGGQAGTVPSSSSAAPTSPVKSEGPPAPKPPAQAAAKGDSPGKGKSKGAGSSADRAAPNKKGQQCIRFYRGICTRGDQCQYGHIVGTDGKLLKIAAELLERCDRYSAARREGKKQESSVAAHMLMLNAIEQADPSAFACWTLPMLWCFCERACWTLGPMLWCFRERTTCQALRHSVLSQAATLFLERWSRAFISPEKTIILWRSMELRH